MDEAAVTGPDRPGRDLRPIADGPLVWDKDTMATGDSSAVGRRGNVVFHGDAPPRDVTVPVPGDGRIRILMLAANPTATARLALDEEARQIGEKLRLARDRDVFELVTRLAVRPGDLLQYLNEFSPQIVHFSGHGDQTGQLVLSADGGGSQPVPAAALAELFRVMGQHIRVVVLNACYSQVQARAISPHIDYIIGMRASLDDESAAVFAAAFYSALAFGRPVTEAFEQAVTAVMLHGLPDSDVPELIIRQGAHPHLIHPQPDPHPAGTPPGRGDHHDTGRPDPRQPTPLPAGRDFREAGQVPPSTRPEAVLLVQAIDRDPNPDDATIVLDWVDLYDGGSAFDRRQPRTPAGWAAMSDDLDTAVGRLATAGTRDILVRGAMRQATLFTIGARLGHVTGTNLTYLQHGTPWPSNSPRTPVPEPTQVLLPVGAGDDLAVAIAITVDPAAAVTTYVKTARIPVREILVLSPAQGAHDQSIGGPGQAVAYAQALRDLVRLHLEQSPANRVHLFLAGPAGLALLLGHRWNRIAHTTVYEDLGPGKGYTPAFNVIA